MATIEQLSSIRAVTSHIGTGAKFRYQDKLMNAGMEVYTPNWTEVDGGDIYPGRNFT